jgi:hypothetical protein
MALHRLNSVTFGVANVNATRAFYSDSNLKETHPGVFPTAERGEQRRIEYAPIRRVSEISIDAENPDDLARVQSQLSGLDVAAHVTDSVVSARGIGAGVLLRGAVALPVVQQPAPAPAHNGLCRITPPPLSFDLAELMAACHPVL